MGKSLIVPFIQPTVISSRFVHEGRCRIRTCRDFRLTLRVMHSQWLKTKVTKNSKKAYQSSFPEYATKLKKIKKLQAHTSLLPKEVEVLKDQIAAAAIPVDEALSSDLAATMEENNEAILTQFPAGSFQHHFWEQQLQATRLSNMKQNLMSWHPVMVEWCLNLKLLSSSSYYALRVSCISHLRELCGIT